jgi:hypothetical protein
MVKEKEINFQWNFAKRKINTTRKRGEKKGTESYERKATSQTEKSGVVRFLAFCTLHALITKERNKTTPKYYFCYPSSFLFPSFFVVSSLQAQPDFIPCCFFLFAVAVVVESFPSNR